MPTLVEAPGQTPLWANPPQTLSPISRRINTPRKPRTFSDPNKPSELVGQLIVPSHQDNTCLAEFVVNGGTRQCNGEFCEWILSRQNITGLLQCYTYWWLPASLKFSGCTTTTGTAVGCRMTSNSLVPPLLTENFCSESPTTSCNGMWIKPSFLFFNAHYKCRPCFRGNIALYRNKR